MPPPTPDDGVGAGEAGSPELRPERGGDRGRLGGLRVGHLGDVDGIPPLPQRVGHPGGERGERRRVHDEHPLDVGSEQVGNAVEHARSR